MRQQLSSFGEGDAGSKVDRGKRVHGVLRPVARRLRRSRYEKNAVTAKIDGLDL